MIDAIVNMMVKNEKQYIVQSLNSILPFVEKAIIFDTGSTDGTRDILKEFKKNNRDKIHLEFADVIQDSTDWNGEHLNQSLTDIRNIMLDMSKKYGYKWAFQVDGDEIYTNAAMASIEEMIVKLNSDQTKVGVMVPIRWCVSNHEYVTPGPFPKTLRIMRSDGRWLGRFPDEFLYIDSVPVFMHDRRCLTSAYPFLHMSMVLHPNRRPATGLTEKLTICEQQKVNDV